MKDFIFIIILAICFSSCSSNSLAERESYTEATPSNSHKADESVDSLGFMASGSGFPDFRNFKYPKHCLDGDTRSFILTDGVYKNEKEDEHLIFGAAEYADVTGDGINEAIVVLEIITGGSMIPECVYIFELENAESKKVKLLWDFQTGDRANFGLRKIYGENGTLIVELFSPEEKSGDCCAKYYIKKTYKWNNNAFEKYAEEKFLNPD